MIQQLSYRQLLHYVIASDTDTLQLAAFTGFFPQLVPLTWRAKVCLWDRACCALNGGGVGGNKKRRSSIAKAQFAAHLWRSSLAC